MKCTVGGVFRRRLLTHHEAHQFVGQDAGADEGHPQGDVELLSDLRLHPHEQAETHTHTQTHTQERTQVHPWHKRTEEHTHTHKKESGHTQGEKAK